MISQMKVAALLMPILHEMNDGKTIKMTEKYPVLKTEITSPEIWWNGLNYNQKVEVGSVAVHYRKMSPNYKWKCLDEHKYIDLTKGQRKIVDFVFSKRGNNWYMFDLASMLKL